MGLSDVGQFRNMIPIAPDNVCVTLNNISLIMPVLKWRLCACISTYIFIDTFTQRVHVST